MIKLPDARSLQTVPQYFSKYFPPIFPQTFPSKYFPKPFLKQCVTSLPAKRWPKFPRS